MDDEKYCKGKPLMIRAIAVDMDGTFLDTNKEYDKARFEIIYQELKRRHIEFIAASGNQYAKLKSILESETCTSFLRMVQ